MNDNNNRSKVRRVRVVTRKWSMEEEQEILHYIKRYLDNLQQPDDGPVRVKHSFFPFDSAKKNKTTQMRAFSIFQKMSACFFFEKMSSAVQFDVISPSQIRNKVRNLQQKYLKAVELRQQMEHILDSETMISEFTLATQHSIHSNAINLSSFIPDNILSICPHWYLLHEIFGSNASSALPFQFSMNQSTNANGETESRTNENDIKIEPMQFADETIADSDFSGDLAQSSDSFQCHDDYLYHRSDNQNDSHERQDPPQLSPRRKDANQQRPPENSVANEMNFGQASKPSSTDQPQHSQHSPPSDNRTTDLYQIKYLKLLEQKYKLDALRLSNENNMKMKEIQVASERFEFEKMCRLKEIDLKRMEIESNERIQRLQLEKEERMEKLKLELDFKIQMAKLDSTKVNQL